MGQVLSSHTGEVSDGYILAVAAKEGHAEVVDMYLKKNAALAMHVTADGNTIVHAACEGGQHAILQMLLSTLCLSAASNTFDPVKHLLDQTNNRGMTALAVAASTVSRGHQACARSLLDAGCSVWARDTAGCMVLHHAALKGNSMLVDMILSAAAELQQQQQPSLQQASQQQSARAVVHRYVNLPDAAGRTALHYAVQSTDLETMHCLITAGAYLTPAAACDSLDAQLPINQGATPLHVAALKGDKAAAVLLLTAYVTAAAGALPELTQPCACEHSNHCSVGPDSHHVTGQAGGSQCSSCGSDGLETRPLQDPRTVTDAYGLTPYASIASHGEESLKQLLNPRTIIAELLEALPDGPASQPGSRAAMLQAAAAGAGVERGDQLALAYKQLVRALGSAGNYLTKQHSQREMVAWKQVEHGSRSESPVGQP